MLVNPMVVLQVPPWLLLLEALLRPARHCCWWCNWHWFGLACYGGLLLGWLFFSRWFGRLCNCFGDVRHGRLWSFTFWRWWQNATACITRPLHQCRRRRLDFSLEFWRCGHASGGSRRTGSARCPGFVSFKTCSWTPACAPLSTAWATFLCCLCHRQIPQTGPAQRQLSRFRRLMFWWRRSHSEQLPALRPESRLGDRTQPGNISLFNSSCAKVAVSSAAWNTFASSRNKTRIKNPFPVAPCRPVVNDTWGFLLLLLLDSSSSSPILPPRLLFHPPPIASILC